MPFETFIKYPIVLAAGLIAAWLITPLWRRMAPAWGFVDQPGGRKIHKTPVPVGGGLAIFFGFHVACAMVFLLPWKPFAGQVSIDWWFRFIPLSIGVVLLGLIDDRHGMKPRVKLAGQIALAVAAYFLQIRIQNVLGMNLPAWVDFCGTILWFLAIMNAFNLIDGVDGLASGIALIAAVGIGTSLVFRSSPGDVLLFAGFAGACLGFLRYNFYPATVFLGDTGSLFIGFTLAALTVSTSSKGTAIAAIGVPLLAVGVPLFDSVLAVWRRSMRRVLGGVDSTGERVAIDQGDAEHLHHRLLKQGRRHDQVAWLLYIATALLALIGVLTTVFNDKAIGILGIAFVVTAYTVVRHLLWIEMQDTGEVMLRGISRPVRRNLTLFFYIAIDLLILNAAWLLSLLLLDLQGGSLDIQLKSAWLKAVPIDVLVPFLVLMGFRSYSRAWSLATITEYLSVGAAGVIGGVVACCLRLLIHPPGGEPWGIILHYVVMVSFAIPCLVGIRAALRIVQDLMHRHGVTSPADQKDALRVLIAGNGPDLMLYFRRSISTPAETNSRIVGIISSDNALRGHYVCGLNVLGNPDDLPVLISHKKINRLVWVGEMSADERAALRQHLPNTGVELTHWKVTEDPLDLAEL